MEVSGACHTPGWLVFDWGVGCVGGDEAAGLAR